MVAAINRAMDDDTVIEADCPVHLLRFEERRAFNGRVWTGAESSLALHKYETGSPSFPSGAAAPACAGAYPTREFSRHLAPWFFLFASLLRLADN